MGVPYLEAPCVCAESFELDLMAIERTWSAACKGHILTAPCSGQFLRRHKSSKAAGWHLAHVLPRYQEPIGLARLAW